MFSKKSKKNIKKTAETRRRKKRVIIVENHVMDFAISHTVPAFCLKNIADKGKVYYANTINRFTDIKKLIKGVNEAGTFSFKFVENVMEKYSKIMKNL